MNNRLLYYLYTLSIFGMIMMASCSKDDDQPKSQDHEHEEELITTVRLEFQTEGEAKKTFIWKDQEEGEAITLKENTAYTLTIVLLNEEEDPEDNVTQEIEEEKDAHQFFFLPEDGVHATYTYGDKDSKDLPVGLTGTFTTQAASTGKLRVVLRHEPAKKSTSGELTNDIGGETDIDIEFPITIEK